MTLLHGGSDIELRRRVIVVSPKQPGAIEKRSVSTDEVETDVVIIGVKWLQDAIAEQDGGQVEIPDDWLNDWDLDDEDSSEAEDDAIVDDDALAPVDATGSGPLEESDGVDVSDVPPVDDIVEVLPDQVPGLPADLQALLDHLRDALVDRGIRFRRIGGEGVVVGATVLQIPVELDSGAKLSSIQNQSQDIARDMGVDAVRLSNWVGHPGYALAELPNPNRRFPDVADLERPDGTSYIEVALGAQMDMQPFWVALDELPHLLIAGTTGSGKSVLLRSLLWQFTSLYSDSELELVLIDGKAMADYIDFEAAPHLCPAV